MSNALRLCKEHYPIGSRWNIARFWWIDFRAGHGHHDRIAGTVTKHWRADGDMPGITLLCDDGREHGGEPSILEMRETADAWVGQMELDIRGMK